MRLPRLSPSILLSLPLLLFSLQPSKLIGLSLLFFALCPGLEALRWCVIVLDCLNKECRWLLNLLRLVCLHPIQEIHFLLDVVGGMLTNQLGGFLLRDSMSGQDRTSTAFGAEGTDGKTGGSTLPSGVMTAVMLLTGSVRRR